VLKARYGDSEILNPEDAKVLEAAGCNIISVDVVYTDFKKRDVQDKLNRKRLTELYFLLPDVFKQSLTQWKYVEQLGYSTEEGARKLFHGIVIKYMKVPAYKPEELKSMFSDLKTTKLRDTCLFRFLDKYVKFKAEELVCVDLTGSMSPYYFQVFVWLNLKQTTVPLNFSFFNDGNETPDYMKKTGDAGGVYLFRTNSIDTITSYAYNCMLNGNGGDTPENNVESILKGVKKYPDSKEIIMIVDNWADMRDYALISEIKNHVRVVVCGTNLYGIKTPVNTQYLDLAKRTGGSIHTMEEDIEDLAKKRDGDEIIIGGDKFVLRGGKFYKK
ncbi:MAG TPA: hypothetical protein VFF27_02245, partial [Bacteroidia bacterium]|nr:hypothetical protein [Bacteroidia bacterium]